MLSAIATTGTSTLHGPLNVTTGKYCPRTGQLALSSCKLLSLPIGGTLHRFSGRADHFPISTPENSVQATRVRCKPRGAIQGEQDTVEDGSTEKQELSCTFPSRVVEENLRLNLRELEDCLDHVRGMENKILQKISKRNRKGEQKWYLLAALASTTGFTTLAVAAVVYRFVWHLPANGAIPYTEIFGTFSLAGGAAVGMEYWARWAHRALWHASLWHMHESHHRPREGPFEMNDIFAIINAVPAIALMLYGFLNAGLVPGLCFGAGLGITMFGISYMFVHDGLVHRRFPVGPIADVPYLKRVAAAHQLHHANLFDGIPYGLFLGPKEIEEVGGQAELEKLLTRKSKLLTTLVGSEEKS